MTSKSQRKSELYKCISLYFFVLTFFSIRILENDVIVNIITKLSV